ncbi:hypothetical protein Dimus_020554, partial [Dionaea muscipula]
MTRRGRPRKVGVIPAKDREEVPRDLVRQEQELVPESLGFAEDAKLKIMQSTPREPCA